MKKLLMSFMLLVGVFFMTSCGLFGRNELPDLDNNDNNDNYYPEDNNNSNNQSEYVIKIDYNNGRPGEEITVSAGSSYTLYEPYKEGYYFKHWIDKKTNQPLSSSTFDVNRDYFVQAEFSNQVDILFDTIEGSNVTNTTATYLETYTLPTPLDTENTKFLGWFYDDNGIERPAPLSINCNDPKGYKFTSKWEVKDNNFEYYIANNEAKVTKYRMINEDYRLEIPEKIKGVKITELGDNLFSNRQRIETLVLPGSLKTIGKDVFLLDKPINEKEYTYISYLEFKGLISEWMNIDFKNEYSVPKPNWNFSCYERYNNDYNYPYPVNELKIPYGTTEIKPYAFASINFKYCVIPDTVKKIGKNAFAGNHFDCAGIVIPSSVTEIGSNAFGSKDELPFLYYKGTSYQYSNIEFLNDSFDSEYTREDLSSYIEMNTSINSFNEIHNDNYNYIEANDGRIFNLKASNGYNKSSYDVKTDFMSKNVVSIGSNAFSDSNIKEVILPDCVLYINGDNTFGNSITEITYPKNLKKIIRNHNYYNNGSSQFNGKMTSIYLNKTLEEYINSDIDFRGDYLDHEINIYFLSNDYTTTETITDLVIPGTIKEIKDYKFANFNNLNTLEFEEGVTTICKGAFTNCYSLASITLPKSIKTIEEESFNTYSDNLKLIKYNGDLVSWTSNDIDINMTFENEPKDGRLFQIKSINGYETLTDVVLPYGLTKIRDNLFFNSRINSITIPTSVTEIGKNFAKTNAIKYDGNINEWVNIKKNSKIINNKMLFKTTGGYTESYGDDLDLTNQTELKDYALQGLTYVSRIYIPTNFKLGTDLADFNLNIYYKGTLDDWINLDKDKFTDYCNLYTYQNNEYVQLSEYSFKVGITEVKPYALYGINSLKKVTLPDGITSIGKYAFYHTSIIELNIPDTVSEIGERAFPYCIEKINVPSSLKIIRENTFTNINDLNMLIIPNGVNVIERNAIQAKSVYLPKSITTLSNISLYSDVKVYYEGSKEEFNKIVLTDTDYGNNWINNIEYDVKDKFENIITNKYTYLLKNENEIYFLKFEYYFDQKDYIDLNKEFNGCQIKSLKNNCFSSTNYKNFVLPATVEKTESEVFGWKDCNIFLNTDTIPEGFNKDWLGYSDESRNKKKVYLKGEWYYNEQGIATPNK